MSLSSISFVVVKLASPIFHKSLFKKLKNFLYFRFRMFQFLLSTYFVGQSFLEDKYVKLMHTVNKIEKILLFQNRKFLKS
jgi:hypothetical protein